MNDMNWIRKKEMAHYYSEYLRKGFNWNYFLTIRTPYKIYTKTPLTWSYRILENKKVDKVFYVVERDVGDWSNKHVHMLLETNQSLDYKETRSSLGKVAVGDFKEIRDLKAVTGYVSKWINDCEFNLIFSFNFIHSFL